METLVFETRNGVIVEVPERLLQTFKEIFMDECYLAGLEREIPSDSTIIDIGRTLVICNGLIRLPWRSIEVKRKTRTLTLWSLSSGSKGFFTRHCPVGMLWAWRRSK